MADFWAFVHILRALARLRNGGAVDRQHLPSVIPLYADRTSAAARASAEFGPSSTAAGDCAAEARNIIVKFYGFTDVLDEPASEVDKAVARYHKRMSRHACA